MEAGGGKGVRGISSRETSPDRARLSYSRHHHHQQEQPTLMMRPVRKVQVIYYLSRNGQLEHPHFIELPQLPNQRVRLRDVMEKLTLLRGEGMPSLFSWSCKRSYKNGYVWNDLAENDVVYPAEGVEYVLKGSEIIPGAYARFQHIPASSRQAKPLSISHKLHLELEEDEEEEEEEQGTEEEEPRRGKRTYGDETNASGALRSRRSRGVSTDEIERVEYWNPVTRAPQHAPTELPLDDSSPTSSTSSDKAPSHGPGDVGGGASRRFEEADQAAQPGVAARSSVLLQLIACGSAALKGRSGPSGRTTKAVAPATSASGGEKRGGGLQRGLVSRPASRAVEEDELRCVPEDPRFCHPLVEGKEYFSGSIVEGSRGAPEPSVKKSSSYNEERSSKLGIGEGKLEGEEARGGVKGKCIPGRRKTSAGKQQ